MSNASATVTLSARISEAAPVRPLLVVEHLDHTFGSTVQFTLCAGLSPTTPNAAAFTLCAGPSPTTPNAAAFTLCAGPPPASFAPATAPVAVEGDAVAGAWI